MRPLAPVLLALGGAAAQSAGTGSYFSILQYTSTDCTGSLTMFKHIYIFGMPHDVAANRDAYCFGTLSAPFSGSSNPTPTGMYRFEGGYLRQYAPADIACQTPTSNLALNSFDAMVYAGINYPQDTCFMFDGASFKITNPGVRQGYSGGTNAPYFYGVGLLSGQTCSVGGPPCAPGLTCQDLCSSNNGRRLFGAPKSSGSSSTSSSSSSSPCPRCLNSRRRASVLFKGLGQRANKRSAKSGSAGAE